MSTGEALDSDYGMNRVERLAAIKEIWLADAARLNAASEAADRRTFRRMYVVDALALLEWEEAGRAVDYTAAERARRLNDLYAGGLWEAAYQCGGEAAPATHLSRTDWSTYLRAEVFARIAGESREASSSYYDLTMELHQPGAGAAFVERLED